MSSYENHDENGKRIQFVDQRFYTKDKERWYPGVTTILGVIDKGEQYKKWLMSNGFNAEILAREAMNQGSNVHGAIQDFLLGAEVKYGENGKAYFTRKEWIMLSRFIDFYTAFSPRTVAVEKIYVSDKLEFGSQIDYVFELNDELWLADHKTGSFYENSFMQLSALRELWNEHNKRKIDRCGILHLESTHRGRDKQGKSIQGKGWKLIPCDDVDKQWEDFKHVHAIWKRQNPNFRPFNLSYPDRYSIETVTQFELPD